VTETCRRNPKDFFLKCSLTENWDYTLKGLSSINKKSVDAIRTAVWEMEKARYITRRKGRNEQGKMAQSLNSIPFCSGNYEETVLPERKQKDRKEDYTKGIKHRDS